MAKKGKVSKALKNVSKLSPSEAVYGFAGWLTTQDDKTVMSSTDNAAPIAEKVAEFNKTNKLKEPKDRWEKNLIHPKKKKKRNLNRAIKNSMKY